ncbi:MAG: BamA/TamA family outer membrane protein [Candidatus Eisenbacteria bacterium]|nr:BamA/TamA family outer membrane protein [Candidatus Eisenbacteria bacterium]
MGAGDDRVPHLVRVLSAVVVAGICVAAGCGGSASAQDRESPLIRSIRFTGNRHVSEDVLRSVMRHDEPVFWNPLKRPRFLGRDVLAQDLLAILVLYRDRGFPLARIMDARVIYEDDLEHVRLRIEIDEGPQILVDTLQVAGARPVFAPELRQLIVLEPGMPLRADLLRSDEERILTFYAERGMPGTTVTRNVAYGEDSLQAAVTYAVDEGEVVTVRAVHVEGHYGSRAEVIRRLLLLEPGDTLVRSRLLESQRRLLRTGLFRSVRILPQIDSTAARRADLLVRVGEKRPGWYGAGVGFSSDDEARLVAEWGHRNLRGRWRALQALGRLKYSLDRTLADRPLVLREGFAEVRFTEPFLFGSPVLSQTIPYFDYERERTFEQDIWGVIQSFRRELGYEWRGDVNFEIRWVATTDSVVLRDHYRTHLTSFVLDQDRRNSFFDPTRGHHYRFVADYAGGFLGGRNEFLRTTVTGSWYTRLPTGIVAAFRLRAGLIQPQGPRNWGPGPLEMEAARVPFEDRYRTGGGTSVRGYKEETLGRRTAEGQPIGGLALFVGNVEVRFPLFWILQGALFLDMGNVWADPAEFKLQRFEEGLWERPYSPLAVAYTLGVGMRLRTPVGPLRVDLGVKVGREPAPGDSEQELHLSLGQPF